MDLHPDFRDFLAEFARSGARYAVLGGYAVGYHAKPRATKDLDVLVSAHGDNLERVANALSSFGAPENVVAAARNMAPNEVVYLGTPPVRIDLMRGFLGKDGVIGILDAKQVEHGPLDGEVGLRHEVAATLRPRLLASLRSLIL